MINPLVTPPNKKRVVPDVEEKHHTFNVIEESASMNCSTKVIDLTQ